MKKNLTFLLICFCLLIYLLISKYERISYNELDEYCYNINNILMNYNFNKANLEKNYIALYSDENILINEIEFDFYDENKKILYIRKDENKIFFILNGTVDDEDGILFVNDSSDSMMDGIIKLKRLGGNSYYYSTY